MRTYYEKGAILRMSILIDKNNGGEVQVTEDGNTQTLFPNLDEQGGGSGGGAVSSVNGQTGTVVLDADDVGAIASPSSPTSGQFLSWDGSAWVATSLPVYSGGVS